MKYLQFFLSILIALVSFGHLEVHAEEPFNLIHVEDLKKLLADKKSETVVFDANGAATRKKAGVVPGAVLLSSSSQYKESELPSDKNKTLVFYCYNEKCMASHDAAGRAQKLGYKNVNVLADGIMGWKEAGEPTA